MRAKSLLFSGFLCALALLPAAASADLQTLDFETGPALGTPFEGSGDIAFSAALGFRPYRTEVGARAHSGTVVGDVGRCLEEEGGSGACEFFQANTFAQLARSADSVTVFAGMLRSPGPDAEPEQAILNAFRADGTLAATSGAVGVDENGFDSRLSVVSAAGDIAAFEVIAIRRSPTGDDPAGDLGIDDVKVDFADGAKPDFAISTTNQVVALVQGGHVDVPVTLARVNGSNGPVAISVSGLPEGVTATVTPNPLPGSEGSATLRLTAAGDAPDTKFVPTDATVTADPLGSAEVGPGPRTAIVSVRVAANFAVTVAGAPDTSGLPEGRIPIEAPDCAPVDVPLRVSRDIAFDQSIALSVRDDEAGATELPPGVSAEILPNPIVPAGGGLIAERTLRIRAAAGADLTELSQHMVLEAKSGSGPESASHELSLDLRRAKPQATIATGLAYTPRFEGSGSKLRIEGTGFCPGTTFEVGNEYGAAAPQRLDLHSAEILTPRYATSGSIVVIPPGSLGHYKTDDDLTVDSVRNSDAFSFQNFGFGSLSLSELTQAFGEDDLFVAINPCWPFGDCRVKTGFLDPSAALKWGMLNAAFGHDGFHCLGMSLAVQQLKSGAASYRQFAPTNGSRPPTKAFDLKGPDGPSAALTSYLDALHVRQSSDEFLREFFRRPKSLQAQIETIEREFRHHRAPMVSMRDGFFNGHALLAYDMVQTPTSADIYVWDNNHPFTEGEAGFGHRHAVEEDVVHIDKVNKTWTYTEIAAGAIPVTKVWKGGDGGSLWAVPIETIPADPSLPGLLTLDEGLAYVMFGSGGASVRPVSDSPGAEFLPGLNGGSAAGTSGTWMKSAGGDPLEITFRGIEDGSYTQSYTAPGFTAGVSDVATARGVDDRVVGSGDSLTFAGEMDRALEIKLAQDPAGAAPRSATLDTHASADGSDSAGFTEAGALTYAHDGAPTSIEFSLTSVRSNGGPSTFESGPVPVGRGDRLSAIAVDRDLHRVRLTIRDAGGATTTRILRNHGRPHGRLKLGRPVIDGRRLTVPFQLSGISGRAVVGASLRLVSGGRAVARKSVAIDAAKGAQEITWRLPRSASPGAYRLLADARAVRIGGRGSTAAGSVTAQRRSRIVVRP